MSKEHPNIVDWDLAFRKHQIDTKIESSSDRLTELKNLAESGLPHPVFEIFSDGLRIQDIEEFISKNSTPFWIGVYPKDYGKKYCKLDLYSIDEVKSFLNELNIDTREYNIVLMQYSKNAEFKGNAIFKNNQGVIEFIEGCNHHLLTRGKCIPDPAIVENGSFKKYSKDVPKEDQEELLNLLMGKVGYFEFGKGIQDNNDFFFFSIKTDKTHLNYFKE